MIGKFVMGIRHLELRHVTGDAVFSSDFADFGGGLASGVAGLAFRIIADVFTIDLLVRIVTGETADASIFGVVAFAVSQTIGLETDVGDAERSAGSNVLPRSMALAAEGGEIFGGQFAQALHLSGLRIASFDGGKMVLHIAVATLALHPGR